MGMTGKPDGFDGTCVESYFRDGKIQEIASYCEGDVIHTYRVWLRYELFRGRMTTAQYDMSESHLNEFIALRSRKTNISTPSETATVNLRSLAGA
jgi:predicted PolB exonuclease-like 3'-5' exonuclease